MKVDVLAFGAHPDDVELACSGTILNLIEQGKKVAIVDLTTGQLGTRGTPELRLQEANKSASILGVSQRVNLGMEDGFFEVDEKHLYPIIEQIRKFRPTTVLCNAVNDRHPDHGRGSELVSRACFLSGLVKIETNLNGEQQEAWRPTNIFHYIQDYYLQPDFVVDITPYFEKKIEAIMAFSSQFYDPESNEPETPISSKEFLDFVESRAREFGRLAGNKFGEGYTTERPFVLKDLTCAI